MKLLQWHFLSALLTAHLNLAAAADLSGSPGGKQFDLVQSAANCLNRNPLEVRTVRGEVECAWHCSLNINCLAFSLLSVAPGSIGLNSCMLSDVCNCNLTSGQGTFQKVADCTHKVPEKGAVIMQRINGNVSFDRNWTEYESGFGDGNGDFWIGLETITSLVAGNKCSVLRVELTLWTGQSYFVEYNNFTVGDASTKYFMTYSAMGNRSSQVTVDGMADNNRSSFSTRDRVNDRTQRNCCQLFGGNGGFWFGNCGRIFPTGAFSTTGADASFGKMIWDFSGSYQSLRSIRIILLKSN